MTCTMGWDTSDRRARLPRDWARRRGVVLARAGYRCEAVDDGVRCSERATDVDHSVRGDDHDLANLQALCRWHHDEKTRAEALPFLRAAMARRPRRKRPPEPHPGTVT